MASAKEMRSAKKGSPRWGQRIRALREAKGLGLQEFGEQLGLSSGAGTRVTIWRWEHEVSTPRRATQELIEEMEGFGECPYCGGTGRL